jgi:hypothetical protein
MKTGEQDVITKDFLLECERYIKNGGILSGAVFTPVQIPSHELIEINPADVINYLDKNRNLLFVQQLFTLIDKTGKKDSEIYKKAGIDRRLFSKIRSSKEYIPAKKTVIALCLALELPRKDADSLLASAGYSLSPASDFDLIISFCIEKKAFDVISVNETLDHFGFEMF